MGKKKNNSNCLYAMMCSFLVLVSLVIIISLYKDYKYRQIYGNVDMSKRRNYHKSAYKTQLSQSSTIRQDKAIDDTPTAVSEPLRKQFYEASTILEQIQVNLTKFGGPVQGQVRFAGTIQHSNHHNHHQKQHHHHHGVMNNSSKSNIVTNRKKIVSFLGIPYAQSPVGSKQFESAKLSTTWTVPLDASRQPSKCPQGEHYFSISDMVSFDDSESEDCLYLSIWTPFDGKKDPKQQKLITKLKPVLVYFHSGLFSFGTISSQDFDPSNLVADEEIVVVTVQHRLGALGFASFDNDSNSNKNKSSKHMSLALGDQIRSLEWIHSNIETFGGNSKQITISGHGSGAITVCAHLLNPVTNQLFHRVIVQGLQNLLNIGIYGLNDRATRTLFEELSCSNDDQTPNNDNSLLALKKCSIKNKVKASSIVEYQHFMLEKHPVPFGPEFEPFTRRLIEEIKSIKADSFTAQKLGMSRLIELFQSWNIFPKHIQFLIGLNSDDDYKFDSANHLNTNIRFDEEEEEKKEESENETDNKNNTSQSKNNLNESFNNPEKENQSNDKEDEDDSTIVATKDSGGDEDKSDDVTEDDAEETTTKTNKTARSSHVTHSAMKFDETTKASTTPTLSSDEDINDTIAVDEDEITTISTRNIAQTPKKRVRRMNILSRMRRAAVSNNKEQKDEAKTNLNKNAHLEEDEISKLCRIVMFYRALKKHPNNAISEHVTIYRIDPRVLQNPLEEVSIAFGARQKKWLHHFDRHLTSLWGSFIKTGNTLPNKLSSTSIDSDSDFVHFINLSQNHTSNDDITSSTLSSTMNHQQMHDSLLSWSTFTDLKTHCETL